MQLRLIIPFLILSFFSARGQEVLRTKKIIPQSDTLQLDSLSLVPGSLSVFNGQNKLDSSFYKIYFTKNAVILNHKLLFAQNINLDTLTFFYKVFPLDFSKEVYHKDIKQLQKDLSIPKNPFTIKYNTNSNSQNFFASDGLTKNGSISRGISFGNNQDVVVNSNLNLQIGGKLTKDIDITLAATDNNIPIQPDGNTQQLQEFDKVFVQLNDKKSKLIVGDYQMQRPNSYFMNFYKRAQGLYFSNNYQLTQDGVLKSTVSGALSRGRFNRLVFRGIENNQGPYRLGGADNELFIVVLSGTERVYIDGRLLTRGQENDYVIDYNSAQITFTAKQLITKDKRITVEFQYSEKNYQRSIYFINEEYQTKKVKVAFSYYSEQDNKNKSLQQTLSTSDRQLLFNIGDTLTKAYTNGAVLTPFNTTEVFYKRKDTAAISGLYKGIYLYTTNSTDTVYRVRFSYLGSNAGNYIQIQSAANGKVYKWIEPLAGVPQGSYEPIVPLVTPKRKQMATILTEIKTSENGLLGAEGAFTSNDINTFSPYDKANDNSQGAKVYYNNKSKIVRTDSTGKDWFFNYGGSYEYLQKNFSQIERFRSVEFFRDWNRRNDSIFNDQHIASASAGISSGSLFSSQYTGASMTEGNSYQGFKHNLSNSLNIKNTRAFYNAAYLTTDNSPLKTAFYRHKSRISQKAGRFLFTYQDEFENNKFKYTLNDSLLRKSYQFWEWEGNITNSDTTKNRFKIFYRERTDKFAYKDGLYNAANAQNIGFSTDISSIQNHPFKTTFTYRKLQILDSNLITVKPDNNLLSRLEYSPRLMRGFFQANTFYEVGYGLEQKKEYSYVQVAAGQGQYYWKDYNGDGIKQLNEFEIAQYPDQMIYIRVYTPTNNFVKSARDQFSLSLYLRPAVFKTDHSKKFVDFMGRFVSQTAYRVDKKTYASNGQALKFNPFDINVTDTTLISTNYNLRQSLFFNQSSAVFGFDYTFQDTKSKQLLTNGYESRELQTHELRTRWNLTRAWGFFTNSSVGQKTTLSQFFVNRNFSIQILETEPKISYQPSTSFRISGIFKYTQKNNTATGGFQKAAVQDYAVELKFNKLSKGSFNARFDYLLITYNDEENTPIAFEMLSSLHAGRNITWSASYQQNVSGNIQISFTYDGRMTPNSKIVHIGGAQVRAFF
ncbi:MAG TPA: hypothetical protein VNZ49_07785 [Bacteroidia bacterium]|nr:hypothetical protein [Bacteroidia bacterium]